MRETGKSDQSLNILDIFFYLLSKWPWFLASVLVCVGFASYRYLKSEFTYFRSATIIIKDPSNKSSSVGLDRFENSINKVNLGNELLQFRSKQLMGKVVSRLGTDVDYRIPDRLRTLELYNRTPVKVSFVDVLPERDIAFEVVFASESELLLSGFSGVEAPAEEVKVADGDSLRVKGETLVFNLTDRFDKSWVGKSLFVHKKPLSQAAAWFLANYGVRQEAEESSILKLSMKDRSPHRAADMLNMLINVYNEEAINDKNQIAVNTADFINERLIIIENELGGVEDALESFKTSNQIIDISTSAGQYIGEAQRFDQEANEQETVLKMAEYLRDYLMDPSKSKDLIPANSGIRDLNIEGQIAQYNQMKLRREKLLEDSSESSPVIQELDNSILAMRQSIVRAVDNLIVNLNLRRQDARNRQRQAEARVSSVPGKERKMLSIERQQKIKESLYLFLLNRREENALSQAMADNNARMVDSPEGSDRPISPDKQKHLLLGGLAGLAFPTVFFLMLLFLDTRVKTRKELEAAVSIPFLGEIPFDKKNAGVSAQGEDPMTESFRILRSNIHFMTKKSPETKVLTVSSFIENSGKTFISKNLAKSLAFAKRRVVVVDLDIRKGALTGHHLRKHPGVTNFLADNSVTLDEIIRPVEGVPGLDIIGAGVQAPNPAELLMDGRLDEMFALLRGRYDCIIADNVPYGIIADAAITNRIADLTVFVVRSGRLDKRQLPDLEKLHSEAKLKNMALVLNAVELRKRGYGYYGSYYGSPYASYGHYSYSYGSSPKRRRRG